jgi:hypothetical protein
MNREDIIRMARNEYGIYAFTAESLAEFATIIAAAECEECAKVCEILEAEDDSFYAEFSRAKDCAAAIRARGNK